MHEIIAIDGPAYVGKSEIAKQLALMTGYAFVNTGHMYRAVAKAMTEKSLTIANFDVILEIARNMDFSFRLIEGQHKTFVNDEDWTLVLNNADYVKTASAIAQNQNLRDLLTDKQRLFSKAQSLIMEGRDISSVVFPNAHWKFFVTATDEIRAKRMRKMIIAADGQCTQSLEILMQRVADLDDADKNRKIAPLVQCEDAIVYDNTDSPDALEDAKILFDYIKDNTGKTDCNTGVQLVYGKH
jgi:cytidylate kinase